MTFMYIKFVMTLLCAHLSFAVAFNIITLVSGSIMEKKWLLKLECADKKLPKEAVFEILEIPFLQNCCCSGIAIRHTKS